MSMWTALTKDLSEFANVVTRDTRTLFTGTPPADADADEQGDTANENGKHRDETDQQPDQQKQGGDSTTLFSNILLGTSGMERQFTQFVPTVTAGDEDKLKVDATTRQGLVTAVILLEQHYARDKMEEEDDDLEEEQQAQQEEKEEELAEKTKTKRKEKDDAVTKRDIAMALLPDGNIVALQRDKRSFDNAVPALQQDEEAEEAKEAQSFFHGASDGLVIRKGMDLVSRSAHVKQQHLSRFPDEGPGGDDEQPQEEHRLTASGSSNSNRKKQEQASFFRSYFIALNNARAEYATTADAKQRVNELIDLVSSSSPHTKRRDVSFASRSRTQQHQDEKRREDSAQGRHSDPTQQPLRWDDDDDDDEELRVFVERVKGMGVRRTAIRLQEVEKLVQLLSEENKALKARLANSCAPSCATAAVTTHATAAAVNAAVPSSGSTSPSTDYDVEDEQGSGKKPMKGNDRVEKGEDDEDEEEWADIS